MEDLIRRLNEDPQRNGLRRLDAFSGLSKAALEQVFSGRRIAFIGDSTLLYLSTWLRLALAAPNVYELDQMDLSQGQNATRDLNYAPCVEVEPDTRRELEENGFSFLPKDICDRVTWVGMQEPGDHSETEALLQAAWYTLEYSSSIHAPPDVLVVNQGLHWLHFYDNQTHTRDTSAEAIRRWIFYEDWLQEVYDRAYGTGVRLLLYKTTNYVCDEKLYGWFQDSHERYRTRDPPTLQACQRMVRDELADYAANNDRATPRPINEQDIANYCVNGTINNHGSTLLNERMVRFVEQKLLPQSTTATRVGIYNDHDLQSCQHCGHEGGLHYLDINLMRIRLLANQLQAAMADDCSSQTETTSG